MRLALSLMFACLTAGGACDCDSTMTAEDLRQMSGKAAARAAQLRELALPPEGAFTQEVTSREEVASYLRGRFEDVDAKTLFALASGMLEDFGAQDPNVDLSAEYMRVAEDQIAGYYDWERRTLYLADWLPGMVQQPILVHEITHALQDHHFGLGRFMVPMDGYGDPQAAVQALIEGDATLVMIDALFGPQLAANPRLYDEIADQLVGGADIGDAPPIIAEMLIFPYLGGLRLAMRARSEGGWAAVDALYADPPLSTEQVLHPEKRLGGQADVPQDVTFPVPAQLEGSFSEVGSDILGELILRFVLRQALDEEVAADAAAGWDGDRAMLLKNAKNQSVTLLASVWDTPDDAAQAFDALRKTALAPVALERRGDRVAGVWGEPLPSAQAIALALLDTMTTTEIRNYQTFEARAKAMAAAKASAEVPAAP